MILSAHNKPFKLERHALNAIKDKPGYTIREHEGGFVGVREDLIVDVPEDGDPITEALEDVLANFNVDTKNIVCPGCGQSYHTTTEQYDPNIDANPSMLKLKPKYISYGWESLPSDPTMGYGCLECPDCGTALAPSGRLRVR